ncbi:hypothetical protein SUGI_0485770 [Cryptomeria japonica]|nr:hypothetical protein SUGI_0485770 [Cryptomeria japonica]
MRMKNTGIVIFAVFLMWVMCGEAKCTKESYALEQISPCIDEGTLVSAPNEKCCDGMKIIARLGCFCDILTSATGRDDPTIVRDYIEACQIHVPDNFKCLPNA